MRLQRTVRMSRVIAAREKISDAVAVAVAACQVWTIVWLLLLVLFRDWSMVVVVVIVESGRAEAPEEDDEEAMEGV